MSDCNCTDCACKTEKLTPQKEVEMLEQYKQELEEELNNVKDRIKSLSAK